MNNEFNRLKMYNWEHKEWANFVYNENIINEFMQKIAENLGEVNGMQKSFDFEKQQDTLIKIIISEAQKTSEIEGEYISRQDLMSSIRKKLGLSIGKERIKDKRAENVALLMLQVREDYSEKLSEKLIKHWHSILFANSKYINSGEYRTGDEQMQIISGAMGKETVHYEAPPAMRVPAEMKNFVEWYCNFETKGEIQKIIIKAAITHLYFESIHPFEDGNGRIGRALIEKCLFEELGKPVLMAISTAIEKNKKQYYAELNSASKTLEIESWLIYFAKMLLEAQQITIDIILYSIQKTHFFDKFKSDLNDREQKVINKMFDAGPEGFEGGMTAKIYISITKTSKATATRDLQHLAEIGALQQQGDGRSVHYLLKI
jgi:Fic family protein